MKRVCWTGWWFGPLMMAALWGCASTQSPQGAQGAKPATEKSTAHQLQGGVGQGEGVGASAHQSAQQSVQRKAALTAMEGRVLASFVLASPRSTLSKLMAHVVPYLPKSPIVRGLLDPEHLERRLAKAVGLTDAAAQLDTTRPVALLVLPPRQLQGAKGPVAALHWLVLALPVKDGAALLSALAPRFGPSRALGGGHFAMGELRVQLAGGYAYVTADAGAAAVAQPLLASRLRSSKDVVLRVHMDRIYHHFRGPLEMGIALIKRAMAQQGSGAGLESLIWLTHLTTAQQARLTLEIERKQIVADGLLTAKKGQALAHYIASVPRGPLWGAGIAPGERIFFLSQHHDSAGQLKRAGDSIEGLSKAYGKKFGPLIKALRPWYASGGPLGKYLEVLAGPSATAITAGAGGLQLVALTKLKAGQQLAARQRGRAFFRALAKAAPRLWQIAVSGLARSPELRRTLKRLAPRLGLRKRWVRRGKLEADLVELTIRWPKMPAARPGKKRKAEPVREGFALLGQVMNHLFGSKLRVLSGVAQRSDGPLTFAILSKDPKATFAALASRMGAPAQPVAAPPAGVALRAYGFVSLTRLVEQVLPVLTALQKLPPQVGAVIRRVLPPVGSKQRGPIDAWLAPGSDALHLRMRLGTDLLEMAGRLAGLMLTVGSYGAHPPVAPQP